MSHATPTKSFWPSEIQALPQVAVPVAGVTGHTMKNHEKQVYFLRFEEGTSVPDHSHGAQWGYLVAGEMTLEIEGRTELFEAGDVYYIPARKKHRAVFSRVSYVIDMSDELDRYA
ncbi:MAG TPA: cupin domain-containing protein [Candidatus Krumholzibacteria bacterium]|nr:cupin domain-containing protein [Candidatus Krumholzibacteria bacterium]HRX52435.1 cupin domain-containing protein [Candidatus Krumholzibacteria bacterium]